MTRVLRGTAALARELGVSPSTLARWQRDGVSEAGITKLVILQDELKERIELEKVELAQFNEFLKLSGESVYYPKVRTSEGKASGPRTQRYQWTRGINRRLTEKLVGEIYQWAGSFYSAGVWPLWQAVAIVSLFGGDTHGSPLPKGGMGIQMPGVGGLYVSVWIVDPDNRRFQKFDREANEYKSPDSQAAQQGLRDTKKMPRVGDFSLKVEISSFRSKRLTKAAGDLKRLLVETMRAIPFIFVHGVTVYNWRVRTEQERKDIETDRRRERSKWKKSKREKRTKRFKRSTSGRKIRKTTTRSTKRKRLSRRF